jgi:16S rRNA (uracil1498-N3)-methyltransferase
MTGAAHENNLTYPGGDLRLYIEARFGTDVPVQLTSAQSHYLLRVMRAKAGESVRVFNGRDGEWLAHISEASKRSCTLVCKRLIAQQDEAPDLWLVFAPIKKTPADYLAQKATELGARMLKPVFTRRTIVKRVNLERMRANAIEAAEQSGRLTVPEIGAAQSLSSLLSEWPAERNLLFCDEAGEAPPVADALANALDGPWAILIGPEGGFDVNERDTLRAKPFVIPVSLGARILRADTAALAALAIWQSIKGDWSPLPLARSTTT